MPSSSAPSEILGAALGSKPPKNENARDLRHEMG